MKPQCECPISGYCDRRKTIVYSPFWKLCQRGKAEIVDRLLTTIKEERENRTAVEINMRINMACQHRSKSIGLIDGCSKRSVFNCNKYSTYCSIKTPQSFPYKLTHSQSNGIISSSSHRSCSICKANKEDD